MSDLISRSELIDYLEKVTVTDGITFETGFKQILTDINNAPTIDAVPVVWKSIEGFEGLYKISNFGEVKNKKGETLKHGIKRTSGTCYKTVRLWKDGKYYNKYIHRLIAEAFIPNPEQLPFINHKDEDGTNNFIENLEWCTSAYNSNYGTARKRQAKKLKGRKSEKRKPVLQYSVLGEFIAYFPSITLAAKELECSTSEISQVCNGKRKTAKGFLWKYDCGADMRKKVEE